MTVWHNGAFVRPVRRAEVETEEVAMSLHPTPVAPVPEETARVARAAFPHGNVYMRMRDELGQLDTDEGFAALFPRRGQPAEAPWRLALVSVMQFAEGLADRQAADAVRGRIDWKYALGLELTDPGFDASVLSEFRTRLVAGSAESTLRDAMLAQFKTAGLLKARGRQRTDSTQVLAAIRALNRLTCVGETLRHALNSLAVVAPAWLQLHLDPAWVERYGPRVDEHRLPKGADERQTLAEVIGADGFRLLGAVDAPDAPGWLREVPAVQTLRRVWLQQYYAPAAEVRWRRVQDLAPAARLINSPYDVEARYSAKRTTTWVGYKVHLTEVCDQDAPHLLTHVETTLGTTQDVELLPTIHASLAQQDLLPREHLVDAGYVDAAVLAESQREHDLAVVGPAPSDTSWQARAGEGFAVACFAFDWETHTATCPQGHTNTKWAVTHDQHGNEIINIRFAPTDCAACPSRAQCTNSRAGPRELTVRPREQYLALQAARAYQTTAEFNARYDARAGVEGTLSQALRRCALRRTRYIGLAKTHLQHTLTAAALNLLRLGAWWEERPFAKTRQARFVALAAAAA
jgi:transposase